MREDDALERLSKKLDSGKDISGIRRSTLPSHSAEAPSAWQEMEAVSPAPLPMQKKRGFGSFEKVFLGSAIFFVAALALAGVLVFFGNNTVSAKNVDIQIAGPPSVSGGDTLTLQIVVTNKNSVSMQLADLIVEFPPGTRSDQDISIPVPLTRITLGTIEPGQSLNRTVKAVVFGAAGADLPVKATVEYRVASSNAIFVKDNTYTAHISQSPATISVSGEKEVVSGQKTTLAITLTSNSPQVLKDMLLIANYPPGYSLQSAQPAATVGNAVWNLGDIEPGGTRTINITGTFAGEDGETRAIILTTGSRKTNSDSEIAAPLAVAESDVRVTKPFVSASIVLNGTVADQHTVARGADIQGQVAWANNLPVAVQNLSIQLKLNGQIIDPSSVRTQTGFYSSSNSAILWDQTTNPDFANVAPGASGALGFSLSSLPPGQGSYKNPTMTFAVNVSASRSTEGNVAQAVSSTASTKAVVSSNLSFGSSLTYVNGPSSPKVDSETVYSVSWQLSNSANALSNAVVTASVPSYVRFIGGAGVTYDKNQNKISWNIGDVNAGDTKSISFQVGMTPSISQLDQLPPVVTAQKASGFDRFVQDSVTAQAADLTTGSAGGQQNGRVTK